jgi:Protein of unknown function (DUF3558)
LYDRDFTPSFNSEETINLRAALVSQTNLVMHQKFFGSCLCGLLILLAGCNKSSSVRSTAAPQTQATPPVKQSDVVNYDPCSLITNQEIEAIEGSPLKETKPSGRSDGGLRFSQCFYTTAEFNRSVSLSVTQTDPDSPTKRSVKEYWKQTFGKYEDERKEPEQAGDKEKKESLEEQRRGKGEEAESVPPKKIIGVGDEAFWIASRVGGALYVLKNDLFIRVSVGGPDPEQGKIDKCKALAQKALARL